MVFDVKTIFSDGEAITNANVISEDFIDFKAIDDAAVGQPVYLNVLIDTAFASSDAVLSIDLIASSGADPDADDKVMEVLQETVTAGNLDEVKVLRRMAIPEDVIKSPANRAGLIYVKGTTALASGEITAFLSIG